MSLITYASMCHFLSNKMWAKSYGSDGVGGEQKDGVSHVLMNVCFQIHKRKWFSSLVQHIKHNVSNVRLHIFSKSWYIGIAKTPHSWTNPFTCIPSSKPFHKFELKILIMCIFWVSRSRTCMALFVDLLEETTKGCTFWHFKLFPSGLLEREREKLKTTILNFPHKIKQQKSTNVLVSFPLLPLLVEHFQLQRWNDSRQPYRSCLEGHNHFRVIRNTFWWLDVSTSIMVNTNDNASVIKRVEEIIDYEC